MEQKLAQASASGVRSLILRGGDFFGPHTGSSWFSQGMVTPSQPLRRITYPGAFETGHAWAYLPDFGETIARLVERESELGAFETFHFGGHWFERGIEIAERIRAVVNQPKLPIRRFPWTALLALSPFVRLFREMAEMRYLWTTPVRLDNEKLRRFLGEEPHTDIDTALRTSLAALGCISGRASGGANAPPLPLAGEGRGEGAYGYARPAKPSV
jgi:nucleoside-diphosphate-sugar epimerase